MQVFEEKIIGKEKVPMSDLGPLKADADCFEQLENKGFFSVKKEQSHARQMGMAVTEPKLLAGNEVRDTFAILSRQFQLDRNRRRHYGNIIYSYGTKSQCYLLLSCVCRQRNRNVRASPGMKTEPISCLCVSCTMSFLAVCFP